MQVSNHYKIHSQDLKQKFHHPFHQKVARWETAHTPLQTALGAMPRAHAFAPAARNTAHAYDMEYT